MGDTRGNAGQALDADDARRQLEPEGAIEPSREPSADSPKPHGDVLGIAGATDPASPDAKPGDSPKRQGDPLEHAVRSGKA